MFCSKCGGSAISGQFCVSCGQFNAELETQEAQKRRVPIKVLLISSGSAIILAVGAVIGLPMLMKSPAHDLLVTACSTLDKYRFAGNNLDRLISAQLGPGLVKAVGLDPDRAKPIQSLNNLATDLARKIAVVELQIDLLEIWDLNTSFRDRELTGYLDEAQELEKDLDLACEPFAS